MSHTENLQRLQRPPKDCPDTSDDVERLEYHVTCYRQFTDITKLERAKKTISNRKNGQHDGDERGAAAPPEKARKSARQVLGSSNTLPKICLVCKKSGPIYLTDKVRYRFNSICAQRKGAQFINVDVMNFTISIFHHNSHSLSSFLSGHVAYQGAKLCGY